MSDESTDENTAQPIYGLRVSVFLSRLDVSLD